jgi:hypothetical protein
VTFDFTVQTLNGSMVDILFVDDTNFRDYVNTRDCDMILEHSDFGVEEFTTRGELVGNHPHHFIIQRTDGISSDSIITFNWTIDAEYNSAILGDKSWLLSDYLFALGVVFAVVAVILIGLLIQRQRPRIPTPYMPEDRTGESGYGMVTETNVERSQGRAGS